MDTMTYASVAVLPRSIAEERTHFVRQDLELLPLDLSMIKRMGTKTAADAARLFNVHPATVSRLLAKSGADFM